MKPIRSFALATAFAVIGAPVAMAGTGAPDASLPEATRLEHALTFATTGCGGAVLQTPQPGTQFASDAADMCCKVRCDGRTDCTSARREWKISKNMTSEPHALAGGRCLQSHIGAEPAPEESKD